MGIMTKGDKMAKQLSFDECLAVMRDNKIEPKQYMLTQCDDDNDYHIDIRVARRVVGGLADQGLLPKFGSALHHYYLNRDNLIDSSDI